MQSPETEWVNLYVLKYRRIFGGGICIYIIGELFWINLRKIYRQIHILILLLDLMAIFK